MIKKPIDASEPQVPSSQPRLNSRPSTATGNGIFRCRDGELKIGLRDCKCLQRPKTPNKAFEYPRGNGLFPIEDGFDGLERLSHQGSNLGPND